MDLTRKVIQLRGALAARPSQPESRPDFLERLAQIEGSTRTLERAVHELVVMLEARLQAIGELVDVIAEPDISADLTKEHAALSAALRGLKTTFASLIADCAELHDRLRSCGPTGAG